MAKLQPVQILTANRLTSGDVVYWRRGHWVEAMLDAELLTEHDAADAALASAQPFVASRAVVNPYLFPVRQNAGGVQPIEEREIIRAAGPSVRRDLGKQASSAGARHV